VFQRLTHFYPCSVIQSSKHTIYFFPDNGHCSVVGCYGHENICSGFKAEVERNGSIFSVIKPFFLFTLESMKKKNYHIYAIVLFIIMNRLYLIT
jgi:hypothetical protein